MPRIFDFLTTLEFFYSGLDTVPCSLLNLFIYLSLWPNLSCRASCPISSWSFWFPEVLKPRKPRKNLEKPGNQVFRKPKSFFAETSLRNCVQKPIKPLKPLETWKHSEASYWSTYIRSQFTVK